MINLTSFSNSILVISCRTGSVFECPKCGDDWVNVSECFKVKAVLAELEEASISCTNHGCTWQGSQDEYMVQQYWIKLILILRYK